MNKASVTLFGFLNFYVLIRILSKEDFGAWVLFMSVASLMEPIKRGFIRNPLVRYLAMHPGEATNIQSASLLLNVVTGLLQMIVLFFCANPFAEPQKIGIPLRPASFGSLASAPLSFSD